MSLQQQSTFPSSQGPNEYTTRPSRIAIASIACYVNPINTLKVKKAFSFHWL